MEKKCPEGKKAITAKIRSLQTLEEQGVSMYDLYGVTPDTVGFLLHTTMFSI